MPQKLFLIRLQSERLLHERIALDQLGGRKAQRDASRFRMVLDEMHDAMQGAVESPMVVILVAEIRDARFLLIACDMDRMLHELTHALISGSGNRYDRDLQETLHLIDQNRTAVAFHFIHHIDRKHHRYIKLHQLHGEIKIAREIRRIHDIDDARRLLFEDKFSRDDFLARIRRKGINPRQIHHLCLRIAANHARLLIHRDPGEIADMLVGACQLVEERRLAAVLIADERKSQSAFDRLDL